MLREKSINNIVGVMKPTDNETYKTGDSHSLCYRKYKVIVADFEREMFEAICKGDFYYMPALSDATVLYRTNAKADMKSNEDDN